MTDQLKRRIVHTAQRSPMTMLEITGPKSVRLMGSDLLTIRVDLD